MGAISELLRANHDGVALSLVTASVQLLAAVRSYLDAGGDVEQAELTLKSTSLMASGAIERAKRIRRRVREIMPAHNQFEDTI